jgi:hypothetical protein
LSAQNWVKGGDRVIIGAPSGPRLGRLVFGMDVDCLEAPRRASMMEEYTSGESLFASTNSFPAVLLPPSPDSLSAVLWEEIQSLRDSTTGYLTCMHFF